MICAFALSSENITLIGTPNPSSILRLKDIIDTSLENLLQDIESGNLSWIKEIDPEIRQRINSKFKPNQLRALQLRELKKKNGSPIPVLEPLRLEIGRQEKAEILKRVRKSKLKLAKQLALNLHPL